jgi:hypothetical protein
VLLDIDEQSVQRLFERAAEEGFADLETYLVQGKRD